MALTVRQFHAMLEEMGNILKLEAGDSESGQPTSLTGEQAFALARRIFPKYRPSKR